jgi:hypothetical protein
VRKYLIFLIIILSLFGTVSVFAEATINSGFIPGQIWYSEEPLVEGDTVNIYTAAWNGEKDPMSAKVEFYDKNVILGTREVTIPSMELKGVFIPWKITSGDHEISAKIISSTVMISGKNEKVTLKQTTTSINKQFVSVVVKNKDGDPVSETDVLKNQLDKASSTISNVVPENVSTSLSNSFSAIDNLRSNTLTQVDAAKVATQKEIGQVLGTETKNINADKVSNVQDATKKPIAYIKLFLLSAASFILGNKIVFYGILVVLAFLIIRGIYRKIRNR